MSHLLNNRYQLLDTLGAGGMGVVYRAQDRLTGESIALKQMVSAAWQPAVSEFALALAREFQALATLRHPHLIAVRDYGFATHGQDPTPRPFFTMELVPHARPMVEAAQLLSLAGRIKLLLQLLSALTYVHRRGIIHRDLKPSNVLVSGQTVKVLDFGLATMAGQASQTSGTLGYMAPELLLGQPASVASDLYAVGVMAYEILVGWHPFPNAARVLDVILQQGADFTYANLEPPLTAVLQQLLARHPHDRYPDTAAATAALCAAVGWPLPPETTTTRESFLQAAPFIGRDRELTQLLEGVPATATATGSAWLVAGESGIGKSRLLHELRTRALIQGTLVLRGQCRAHGGAYHLWQDVLPPLLLLPAEQLDLSDLEAAVLQPILPDIEQLLERTLAPAPALAPTAAQTRLHLTVATTLHRAARHRPILLVLEDLHQLDPHSLDLLALLCPQTAEHALTIVGSYRLGERPTLAQELPHTQLLSLGRLSVAQVADLCAAALGENGRQPHLVQFVHHQTEGNTFFIVEVLRTLAEEVGRLEQVAAMSLPSTIFAGGIQEVVKRRLARIPATYQPLLQTAALVGRRLDWPLLGHLFPHTDLEEWLTICANAAVLERPDGDVYWQFSHDKLREGLLAQLEPAERPPLHRHIAHGLETVYANHLAPHYADAALHWGQAGDVPQQRHYLKLAGQYAEENYAGETAVAHYAHLATLCDEPIARAEALLAEATVRQFLGQLDGAETAVQAALAQLLPTGQTGVLARAHFLLGRIGRSRSQWPEAIRWLRQAEEGYTAVPDPLGLCDTLAEIGVCHYHQGEYTAAATALTTSLHLAYQQEDTKRVISAQHNLGNVSFDQGDYELTQQRYSDCLALSREIGDRAKEASALNNLGILASYQGDTAATRHYYEQSLAIRQQIGDRAGMGASLNNLGILARDAGDYERALDLYGQALHIARELGDKRAMSYPLKNMGVVRHDQGRYAEAEVHYQEALALRREIGEKWGVVSVLHSLGDVYRAQQQEDAALRCYRESLQLNGEIGDHQLYVSNVLGVAAVFAHQEPPTAATLGRVAHLLGFADQWMAQHNVTLMPELADGTAALRTLAENHLGHEAYTAAYHHGSQLTLSAALSLIAGIELKELKQIGHELHE